MYYTSRKFSSWSYGNYISDKFIRHAYFVSQTISLLQYSFNSFNDTPCLHREKTFHTVTIANKRWLWWLVIRGRGGNDEQHWVQSVFSFVTPYNAEENVQSFGVIFYLYLQMAPVMEFCPSWEAANCADTQELPSISWNPKVHYCVYKRPPLTPTLNQINPIHTIPFYLRSILTLPTHLHLGCPCGLFPSGFPTNTLYAFLFAPVSATCSLHLILLDLIILILPRENYKLWRSSYSFLQPRVTSSLFSSITLITLSLCTSLTVRDKVSHTHRTTGTMIVLYILIFMFWQQTKRRKVLEWTTASVTGIQSPLNFLLNQVLIFI
jgi:hypothetical protein